VAVVPAIWISCPADRSEVAVHVTVVSMAKKALELSQPLSVKLITVPEPTFFNRTKENSSGAFVEI
jgi:hypothetical protein